MKISVENAAAKFTDHFNQPGNERILFSGKFGTGKSYFLKEYFEKRKSDFNLFWLTPVNYVVGANQDIFEWIKIDVAKELVKYDAFSHDKENYSSNFLLQTHIYQNASSIFTSLLTTLAGETIKIKTGFDFLKGFLAEIKDFQKYYRSIKEIDKSHFEQISHYLDESFQLKGSIYEDNLTTQTIRASIELLKFKSKKRNILVIDDLDRLDPEHIFRILNILSAHNDHFDTNKFGFDKVILVCDYKNIQHIYEYKYGKDVDFEGYIEKFYSFEPFNFTIYDAIIEYCNSAYVLENLNEDASKTMGYLLILFYKNRQLRIRNLKKIRDGIALLKSQKFKIETYFDEEGAGDYVKYTIDYNGHPLVGVLWLLCIVHGGAEKLLTALHELHKSTVAPYYLNSSYIESIHNSISIMHHIATSSSNPNGLFYSATSYQGGVFRTKRLEKNILGYRCIYNTNWGTNDMAYSEGDFFQRTHVKFNEPIKDERQDWIPDFIQSLIRIMDHLIKKDVLHNINQ